MAAGENDGSDVIEVTGLAIRFGRTSVLEGVDLSVRGGEVLGIVGGSGSGKSLLMKSMINLITPTAGRVAVLGHDLRSMSSARLHDVKRRWGVLFQDDALFSSLNIMQNLGRVVEEHADVPNGLLREIVQLKLALVGLEPDVCARFPSELSGGMRKKAGLARALALDPEILFLDEPTAGLDPPSASNFDSLILELHDMLKLTVVLVTHDLDTVLAICDRVAVIADGSIVASGSLDEVMAQQHPWIEAFFHGPRGRAAAEAGRRSHG